MPDEMPEKSAQQHNGLSCQATIRKGLQGYTVTLTMRQNGTARVLVDKVVESYAEAETVARAFAAQQVSLSKTLYGWRARRIG